MSQRHAHILAIDDDDPLLHVLDHQLVDLGHVGQIDFALRGQLLAGKCALGQGVRQPGDREIGDRQQPGLHVLATAF